jgi:type VI secretion system secreted protein Hcp
MSVRHYIKFDGVEGESTHKDHKGEIDVLSWSWGLSAKAGSGKGGGAKTGKVKAHEFTFTHLYDKASPALAKIAILGRHIKQAVLTASRAGEGQKDFLKITMKEVFVTSVEQVADETNAIAESVSVRSADIAFEYRPTDAKGSLGAAVTVDWDIADGTVT